MSRVYALIVALMVAGGLGAGCAASGDAARPASATISVLATIGPTQPVCRAGSPCSAPYRGRVLLRSDAGHASVIEIGRSGRATVSLSPGMYEIPQPAGESFPRLASVRVNGRSIDRDERGSYVFRLVAGRNGVRLMFDTGIR